MRGNVYALRGASRYWMWKSVLDCETLECKLCMLDEASREWCAWVCLVDCTGNLFRSTACFFIVTVPGIFQEYCTGNLFRSTFWRNCTGNPFRSTVPGILSGVLYRESFQEYVLTKLYRELFQEYRVFLYSNCTGNCAIRRSEEARTLRWNVNFLFYSI